MLRKKTIGLITMILLLIPIQALAAEQPEIPEKSDILSLGQCIDLANSNNQQIREAEKEVVIAQGAVKQAQAAFWLDVNYQGSRDQSNIAQYQIGPRYEKTDFKGGINASVPLYTGGILQNNLKLAEIGLETAKESLRKAKQSLTYEVKQAFYNVWLAGQMLNVQKNSYNNLDHHLRYYSYNYIIY